MFKSVKNTIYEKRLLIFRNKKFNSDFYDKRKSYNAMGNSLIGFSKTHKNFRNFLKWMNSQKI